MAWERYYVDERIGCIAVRDRRMDSEDEPGLDPDTVGVVKYWHGEREEVELCPTCHHRRPSRWILPDKIKKEAHELCDSMNRSGQ